MKSALCLVPLALALAGCGGGSARPEGFAVALPPAPQVEPDRHRDGAIYQASHGYAQLADALRARGFTVSQGSNALAISR